ncbi:MAG TPA: DNA-processing protein DprA [Steroidobacteraceae bacterium]|nr:DNA-processing protein DprA [Steroidobacteraceae bacterium]
MDELRACALLARAPGLTAERLRAAVAQLGQLEFVAEGGRVCERAGLEAHTAAFLRAAPSSTIDADLRWLAKSGAQLIPCTSPRYPELLARTEGAPAVLYVLGEPSVLASPQLSMVGARAASAAGRATARELATELVRAGLTITSGLALGIDAASHEGALAGGGMTVAVCAHGLDTLYPRQHRALAQRIRERGALVSEFPPGTPPRREMFPQRNRIISALSLGTLVVEAATWSGSLITARCAGEQGREVFAVPGSIRNPLARGCHQLIREGATLVESAADVLAELKTYKQNQQFTLDVLTVAGTAEPPPSLDKDYEMLLDALDFEPVSIDTLVERTGLSSGSIASMLLILELGGRVAPHPGGRYGRLS